MKKVPFLIVFFTLFFCTAQAQHLSGSRGIGVIIGEPTGISLAYHTTDGHSFAAGTAWHFLNRVSFHLHVDYLFYQYEIIRPERGSLPLYFGVGARLRFDNTDKFGIRFPLGIAYHFDNEPVELFFEIVPIMELMPGTKLAGNSGIGIRYYF